MKMVEHLESRGLPVRIEHVDEQVELTTEWDPGKRWVALDADRWTPPSVVPARATRRRTGTVATIEVEEPEPGESGWNVSSDDLVEVWGMAHGPEADDAVAALLAERAPHLLETVRLDSFEETFSAYTDSRETAEKLKAFLISVTTSARHP